MTAFINVILHSLYPYKISSAIYVNYLNLKTESK